jgi:hypothetical protein
MPCGYDGIHRFQQLSGPKHDQQGGVVVKRDSDVPFIGDKNPLTNENWVVANWVVAVKRDSDVPIFN